MEERCMLLLTSWSRQRYSASIKREHVGSLILCMQKAGYMPDFEGTNLQKQSIHTTDLLAGKISLMSFVYAKYGEVSRVLVLVWFAFIFILYNRVMSIPLSIHSWNTLATTRMCNWSRYDFIKSSHDTWYTDTSMDRLMYKRIYWNNGYWEHLYQAFVKTCQRSVM